MTQLDLLKFRHLPLRYVGNRLALHLCAALVVCSRFSSAAQAVPNLATVLPDRPSPPALALTDAVWESDTGAKVRFSDLQGDVQVVSLFYSSCHVTCPMTLLSMKQVEAALPVEVRSQVGFVLITFVPEMDSAQTLHRFRGMENLSAHWTLLRGSKASTRKVSDLLRVSFSRDSYRLTHTPQIAVIDSRGRIVFRQQNLRSTPGALVSAVRSALATKTATGL
jgi:protein SCO1/2